MTFEIALLFSLIGLSLVLFALERFPADVISLGLLATLVITGLLPVDQAFNGFSNPAVITILGLLILSSALLRTGVVALSGRVLLRRAGDQPERILAVILIASALIGAFMSNTASTAFFIPIVLGIARRTSTSPSRLLMPLAFASILSSSVTLISTSTNLVVSGLMTEYQMEPMGMFELAPVGIPITIAGLLYVFFIGRRLVPDRAPASEPGLSREDQRYLTEVVILPDSNWAGKTLKEAAIGKDLDLHVLQVVRDDARYLAPQGRLRLKEGDVLLVEGNREKIIEIKGTAGIDIREDTKIEANDLESEETRLAEGIILIRSRLIGRTLEQVRFRQRYGLQVLAVSRRGEALRSKISQIRLKLGDVLLLQGPVENLTRIDADQTLRIIGGLEERPPNLRRAPFAVGAFTGALILGTLNIIPFSVAMILGVLVVFLSRTLNPDEAYRDVEWRAIILIGSMLGVGAAMETTGAAEWLAVQLVEMAAGAGPVWLLTIFFALTVLLTQPMSNQAAAVVVLPIAIQTALQLDLNPRSFAMMVALAASTSYLTPLEPSCLMVYGPGRYRFTDFLKVGSLLTLIIYLITIFLVPIIWPLR